MTVKNLWWIVAILALVLLALSGQKYLRQRALSVAITRATLQQSCHLEQAACTARFDDGQTVTLNLSPRPIPLLKTLQLSVQLSSGQDIQRVDIDFVGTNMDMGFNRSKLSRKSTDFFQGTGVLSICTQRRMEWEAQVFLHTKAGMKLAIFPFYTINKAN